MNSIELKFVEMSTLYENLVLNMFGFKSVDDVPDIQSRVTTATLPVIIKDFEHLTKDEIHSLKAQYLSTHGLCFFYVENLPESKLRTHPIITIANQLKDEFNLKYPISYPYDSDKDTKDLFGLYDGTTKVYKSEIKKDSIGLSTLPMAPHQDGMGNGGSIHVVAFYCDSPPLYGGYTYFQNIVRLSLDLLKQDRAAFQSLFLPNAMTYIRKNNRKGIKITSPILYINNQNIPTSNLKFPDSLHAVRP